MALTSAAVVELEIAAPLLNLLPNLRFCNNLADLIIIKIIEALSLALTARYYTVTRRLYLQLTADAEAFLPTSTVLLSVSQCCDLK